MKKYVKKPVEIEAWHFTKENYNKGVPSVLNESDDVTLWLQVNQSIIAGEIETLEGTMKVSENDYIIKGVNGEFYPCKPDIFEKTYAPVER